jgi:hypothetical protein
LVLLEEQLGLRDQTFDNSAQKLNSTGEGSDARKT